MNLIVALVIASLVYIVQKRLYAKWWNRNLDVTISFEDTCVREGDASALTEVIYNGKFCLCLSFMSNSRPIVRFGLQIQKIQS